MSTTTFYNALDHASVSYETYQFVVHMPLGDIFITIPLIAETTNVPSHPHHSDPLPLIDYMPIMGVRCTEQDRGLKANTTFRNVHCVGRWIQRNILGLEHATSFNRPVLQIIHDLMTRKHTVCLNKAIFHAILTNSSRTRGAKHSHPIPYRLHVCVGISYQTLSLIPLTECMLQQRDPPAPITVACTRFGLLMSNP